jgi:hypothetical protein
MTGIDRLLGTWDITMHHSAMSEPVTGRERYERILDDAFVLQHRRYDHPDFPDALAVLSEETCHYFDVRGVIRVFDVGFDDEGWSMVRLDPEFAQRYTARFRSPDAIECHGELSRDGGTSWQHDFTMTYQRVEDDDERSTRTETS